MGGDDRLSWGYCQSQHGRSLKSLAILRDH